MIRIIGVTLLFGVLFSNCGKDSNSCEIFIAIHGDKMKLKICDSTLEYNDFEIDDYTFEVSERTRVFTLLDQKKFHALDIFVLQDEKGLYYKLYTKRREVGSNEVVYIDESGFDISFSSLDELNNSMKEDIEWMEKSYSAPLSGNTYLKIDKELSHNVQIKENYGKYYYTFKPCKSIIIEGKTVSIISKSCKNYDGKVLEDERTKYNVLKSFKWSPLESEFVYCYIVEGTNNIRYAIFVRYDQFEGVNTAYFTAMQEIGDCSEIDCIKQLTQENQVCPMCFGFAPWILE